MNKRKILNTVAFVLISCIMLMTSAIVFAGENVVISVNENTINWTDTTGTTRATYVLKCSKNGAEAVELYRGNKKTYTIENTSAVCKFTVEVYNGETLVESSEKENVIIRDILYPETQSIYGNIKNAKFNNNGSWPWKYGMWGATTNTDYNPETWYAEEKHAFTQEDFNIEEGYNIRLNFDYEVNGNKENTFRMTVNKKDTGEVSSLFDVTVEAEKGGYVSFLMYDKSVANQTTDNLWVSISKSGQYPNKNNNATVLKGYPTNQWVLVTLPFSAFPSDFDFAKLQCFGMGLMDTADRDHVVYVQSIKIHSKAKQATTEFLGYGLDNNGCYYIEFKYDKEMDSTSVKTRTNYVLTDENGTTLIDKGIFGGLSYTVDKKLIRLTYKAENRFEPGTSYTLTISNVRDGENLPIDNASATITFDTAAVLDELMFTSASKTLIDENKTVKLSTKLTELAEPVECKIILLVKDGNKIIASGESELISSSAAVSTPVIITASSSENLEEAVALDSYDVSALIVDANGKPLSTIKSFE